MRMTERKRAGSIGGGRHQRPSLARPRTLLTAAFAAIAGMFAAGCSANLGEPTAPIAAPNPATEAAPAKPRTVKIAMLLPLAGFGPAAAVAKSMKQAGELALFERDNPNVQLLVKDDAGTPEGARNAADQAIREGAEVILGPLFSQSVSAAAPVARAGNVPMIAFSNDVRTAGSGVYLMSFLAGPEVERVTAFAASRGKRRFAALIPGDAYGDGVEPVFRRTVLEQGGTLVHVERYPLAANGMLEPVKRVADAIKEAELAGSPVDALFLPAGADSLPQLASLLVYNGVDPVKVKLIGTGAWDFPNIGREPMLAGGWYPSPDPRGWQDFSARFAKSFGAAPPRVASLAYDAVSLAVALSSTGAGPRFTAAALTDPRGFPGVDGNVTFSASGLPSRGLAVLEIQPYGNSVVDPAPSAGYMPAPRFPSDGRTNGGGSLAGTSVGPAPPIAELPPLSPVPVTGSVAGASPRMAPVTGSVDVPQPR